MRFSVLVPVYNVEKYLEQCLDSILAQTFRDFEVLLTDDGSTDSSGEICDRYAKEHPGIFRVFHKKNEGLLLTRRHGLREAQGDYIVFVDSDDYVANDLLETIDRTIITSMCDMVIYNFYRFLEGENGFSAPNIPFKDGEVFEGDKKKTLYEQFILNHTFVNLCIKAVRKDLIDYDFDYTPLKVNIGEDIMQSFPLLNAAKRIVYIDKKLYYYRKNSGSMTLNIKQADLEDYLKLIPRTEEYIAVWGFEEAFLDKFRANRMEFFYQYLRTIRKITNKTKDNTLYQQMSRKLMTDQRYICVVGCYKKIYTRKRLRIILSLMKSAVLSGNLWLADVLINISNLISKQ